MGYACSEDNYHFSILKFCDMMTKKIEFDGMAYVKVGTIAFQKNYVIKKSQKNEFQQNKRHYNISLSNIQFY